jgi:dienelactone hydrolase
MAELSSVCMSIPPVTSHYTENGTFTTLASLHTYAAGPPSATKGIIFVYDIFGMSPQTYQACDRLTAYTGAAVLAPDFFEGNPLTEEVIARDTPEKQERIVNFMSGIAKLETNVDRLVNQIFPAAKEAYPKVTSWGVFGLCWGGKVGVLASIKDPKAFKVSGQAHPGMFVAEDAKSMKSFGQPHICLASENESADTVKEYKEILGDDGYVEQYDMFHGWMGARANLEDEKNRAEFERGYDKVGEFFAKHL